MALARYPSCWCARCTWLHGHGVHGCRGRGAGQLFGVSDTIGVIFASVIVVATLCLSGRPHHRAHRHLTFVYLFSRVIAVKCEYAADPAFCVGAVLLAVSLAASWQIAYGPYVADYSATCPDRRRPVKSVPWR